MPDLSDLGALLAPTIVQRMLGDPGFDAKARLHRLEFVRLLAKSIQEYQLARKNLIAQVRKPRGLLGQIRSAGRLFAVWDFTDHMETCINATHRCLRNLEGMTSGLALDRQAKRALAAASRGVAPMRHTLEHMDERIQKGRVGNGEPLTLVLPPTGDRVVVAGHELLFEDLVKTLRRLHGIGVGMFPQNLKNDTH